MKKIEKKLKKCNKNKFFKDILSKISYFFDKYIFPDDIKCIFCGRDIPSFYDKPYCSNCEKTLPFNEKHICKICSLPIKNEAKICQYCQKNKRYFKTSFIPFLYQDIVRKNILEFKFENKRYLAKGYATIIAKLIKNTDIDLITFVPMTKKKQKEKGYNQAEILALNLSKITKIPFAPTLEKMIETKEQKGLNYKERSLNLKNAFKLIDKNLVKDKNILLVDDIVTTCATVNVCSQELSKYAKNIYISAIARNELKEN